MFFIVPKQLCLSSHLRVSLVINCSLGGGGGGGVLRGIFDEGVQLCCPNRDPISDLVTVA